MTTSPALSVRVRATTWEAEGILGFELVPLSPGEQLPAFTAGAHIDLYLRDGMVRSYSLLNDPCETHRYRIGVNRDAKSRGGSQYLHEALRTGSVLTISVPRNNFPLDESSPFNVFIAGGIGITPLLSMIARSQALGTPWRLHYAARTRAHAGFLDLLEGWRGQPGAEVQLNFDQEPGGRMLDLAAVIAELPEGAHVYCCGPLPMLEAYAQATAALPPGRVHREYFAAKEAASTDGGFSVVLARSGRTVPVRAGQTILDSLIEAGIEPTYSCREGVCGTCEQRVIDGTPDHRDLVLSDAQKAANDRILICCSGSRSRRLVLDL
ncbi:PDR/VanB family oxidoreductase [Caldimonas tepidiphila]|uniref:PDR/VanB family oxidoreductase n=1 Tax=Caldimonas tepidiphila TaxID=2315841 RepID=UPI000E5B7652|nr:PDR/VanB family oxidoreductase [Caldimonas tepidiphila]